MNAPLAAAPVPPEAEPPACLIVNPKSFLASRGDLAARAVALAQSYGADVVELDASFGVLAALDERLARGVQRIFILAGDGTIHAIVEHLARLPQGSALPELLLLGGGRTNLTAGEFDGNGDVLRKLDSALSRHRDGVPFAVQGRHLLVLEQEHAPARHGFLVVAGLVDEVVRECHQYQRGEGNSLYGGQFATPIRVLTLVLQGLVGRSLLESPQMHVDAGAGGRLSGPIRVLLASTLEHRTGLYCPYADRGTGPLRVTAVTSRTSWFLFPLVAMGRFLTFMNEKRGYLSGRCERIEVLGLHRYALDGEEFDADPLRPVVIRPGVQLSFLAP